MIGNIIKEARKNQKLSQRELAELTGLTQTGISKLEQGVSGPSVKTLRRIADTLGIQDKIFTPEEHMIDDEIDMDLEKRVERRVETRLEARLEARLESRLKEDITHDLLNALKTKIESRLKEDITNDLLNEFDKRLRIEFDKRFEPILQMLTRNLSCETDNKKQ